MADKEMDQQAKIAAYNWAWKRTLQQNVQEWQAKPSKAQYRLLVTNAYRAYGLGAISQQEIGELHPILGRMPIVLLYVKTCPVMFNPALKKQVQTVLAKSVKFLQEHHSVVARQLCQDYLLKLRALFLKKGWALDKEVYNAWLKDQLSCLSGMGDATPSLGQLKQVLRVVQKYERAKEPNTVQQMMLTKQLGQLKTDLIAQQEAKLAGKQMDNDSDKSLQPQRATELTEDQVSENKFDPAQAAAKAREAAQRSREQLDHDQSMGEHEARAKFRNNSDEDHTHLVINIGRPGERLQVQTVPDSYVDDDEDNNQAQSADNADDRGNDDVEA